MEGKAHSSRTYNPAGKESRMQADLAACSRDLVETYQYRPAIRAERPDDDSRDGRLHVGVIGAGLAGLRCAQVLAERGARVTIVEARDRLGGRVCQGSLNGFSVDLGPNWCHGTDDNPIVELAKHTKTTPSLVDETTVVYGPDGKPMPVEEVEAGSEEMWSLIGDAFKLSNEECGTIVPQESLKDFFAQRLAEKGTSEDKKRLIMLLGEVWGSFIGDPWEKQSLKWFWLEECLDGDNLLIADTHKAIIDCLAESISRDVDIYLNTTVTSIDSRSYTDNSTNPKVIVTTNNCRDFSFHEVICTVPLGCLKARSPHFLPEIPERISRAISNASYSSLEKVYIAFRKAFWDSSPATGTANGHMNGSVSGTHGKQTEKPLPSFAHFIHPSYMPSHLGPEASSWALELVPLSSHAVFGEHARPCLLFYTFGPCAAHITEKIRHLDPTTDAYYATLDAFFRPFYSRLPGFNAERPECTPTGFLATDWRHDELAGWGSYTNFQVSPEGGEEIQLDEDVRVMRSGMPERGVWFAGEHTAPFVALGTSTGAYWSGEMAAVRVLAANGLMEGEVWGD